MESSPFGKSEISIFMMYGLMILKSLPITGKTSPQMDMPGQSGNIIDSTKFGDGNIVQCGDANIAGFGAMFGITIPWKYTYSSNVLR